MQVDMIDQKPLAGAAVYPNRAMVLFIVLQCLDLLTTLAIFAHGGVELNPVVRSLMPWTGQLFALILSKALLVSLVLLLMSRRRILRFANIFYAAVVAWNAVVLSLLLIK